MSIRFRHEWKHEVSRQDLLILRQRLRAVMKPDPHAVDGKYTVRSLYFDNWRDKALREKIDGVNCREKFRIRYYDGNPETVLHLEKKSKRNGLSTKYSANLTVPEVQMLLDGRYDWMMGSGQELVREFGHKIRTQGLAPRTIVEYTREPFVFAPGNVRVTIDYDLRTATGCRGFLDPDCVTIPAGDPPVILEVKWDDFLPAIICDTVQLTGRHASAFSKYAQCRIYG